jgi:IS605 OrfB family transposase
MKLIVNLKLHTTKEHARVLRETLELSNQACNIISEKAWNAKTFKQFDLHKLAYKSIRESFNLSAQIVVRCIAKVADAYKLDKRVQRKFRKYGAVSYDDRIISFKKDDRVSIWTVGGRQTIPFACGGYQRKLLPFRKGEVDLIYRKGNFYLNAVCEVDEPLLDDAQDVLGIDFGVVNIITDSDGKSYSGKQIDKNSRKLAHRRHNLQKKGTRSARRKLKKLSGKQARYQKDVNHCLSKQIVREAKGTHAIAIEDLKHIRKRVTVRKSQRARLSNWAFGQLRNFIEYKAKLVGVEVIKIDPRNTSRECSRCRHVDKKNRQTQDKFLCRNCGYSANADFNASRNIRLRAMSMRQTDNSLSKVA